MEYSLEYEIGIVDYRNILKAIKDKYDYDFSDYALTSFKRRVERVMQLFSAKSPEQFIERIVSDPTFFNMVIHEILVESTEMFRDPSFWRFLRDTLLPAIIKENYKSKIWLPSCISGDELFTLLIILKEEGWYDKAEVIATCFNDNILNRIKKGELRHSKIEVSNDNYSRYQGKKALTDYYALKGEHAIRDTSLIKNVNFIKQNINFDKSPQDVRLIIYRNQLIYMNQTLHDKVLKVFYDSLMIGGHLSIGAKEQVGIISSKYFRIINEEESIYKKI